MRVKLKDCSGYSFMGGFDFSKTLSVHSVKGEMVYILTSSLLDAGADKANTSMENYNETWSFGPEMYEVVNDYEAEYTGGSSSYYMLHIDTPTTLAEPYDCETNDIIEALEMTPAEANIFKAVWRKAAARTLGKVKKGYDNGLYDAEKCAFFSERMIVKAKKDLAKGTPQ